MTNANANERVYILIELADYERAVEIGYLSTPSLATEGFIHASPAEMLTRVANRFFAKATDIRLLHVEAARVKAPIRWEPASDAASDPAASGLYPHLYGALNLDAIVRVGRVWRDSDGKIRIDPKEL